MEVILWAVLGYLFGSLPVVWVVAQLAGRADVLDRATRTDPSTDAHRLLGRHRRRRAAIAAAILNALKVFVPVGVGSLVAGPDEAAGCLVGAVAGHCWPPVLRRFAGRGLDATAGGMLAVFPVEVLLGGVLTGLVSLAGRRGLALTLGIAAVPVFAVLRGQYLPLRVAAVAVVGMILARRLEGVSHEMSMGVPWRRAAYRRAVLDAPERGVMPVMGRAVDDNPPDERAGPDVLERFLGRGGRRIVVTLVGGVVLSAGVLGLVLPAAPGLPFVAAGLAILATEYRWARRALQWVKNRLHAARERARRRNP